MKRLHVVALLLASLWGPAAFGHGGSHATSPDGMPTVMAKLPGGISLQVVETNALQFSLATNGCCEVEVMDDDGQPFIRIGKTGVQANMAAPAWYRAQMPGGGKVPEQVKAGGPPKWVQLSDHPGFGWYDRRLNEGGPESFTVTLNVNGKPKAVAVERIPPAPKGVWKARIVQEPTWDAVYSILSGAGGEAIVIGLLPQADGELLLLDDKKRPVLKLSRERGEVNTKHPWHDKLNLKTVGNVVNGWSQLSGGSKVVMANPLFEDTKPTGPEKARLWMQYQGEQRPLTIQREWIKLAP